MILIFYIFIALSAYNTSATPTPFLIAREVSVNAETSTNQGQRTLFGIVWGCLSTTILCAWMAVHPNVPPRSRWKGHWNRLKLMFCMVVAPELVLVWAVRQFFAAREIRDEYNRSRPDLPEWKKWTLIHGHMVGMGGFTLVEPNPEDENEDNDERRSTVLTFDRLKRLLQDPGFRFRFVAAADIADRSKGDMFFRLIAILQTIWFILQCIARGQQGLALAELELITLALVSLIVTTFGIWWYKPLGVQEPVKIYFIMELLMFEEIETQRDHELHLLHHLYKYVFTMGWRFVKIFATLTLDFVRNPCEYGLTYTLVSLFIFIPIQVPYIITFPFFILFPLGIVFLLRIIETEPIHQQTSQRGLLAARIIASLQQFRYVSSFAVTKFIQNWFVKIFDGPSLVPFFFGWFILLPSLFILLLAFAISLMPLLALLFLLSFIFTSVFGIVTTSTIHSEARHVPSFYALTTRSDRWSRMVVFATIGPIFGGLHCIGWNFEFPTHSEQALWRATSLAITFIPLIVAPIDFLLTARLHNHDINSYNTFERSVLLILDFIMTILLFIYLLTRLSLIAQALALLRQQPSSALLAVDWTKYVPHLFSSS